MQQNQTTQTSQRTFRGWAKIRKPKTQQMRFTREIKEKRTLTEYSSALARERDRRTDLWSQVLSMKSELCDVKFGVTDRSNGQRIWMGANKQRLMDHCHYFSDLWNPEDNSEESKDDSKTTMGDGSLGLDSDEANETGLFICSDDISEAAMQAVIAVSFAQFDCQLVSAEGFADLLIASEKFGVPILKDCCEQIFENVDRFSFEDCLLICADLFKMGLMDRYQALAQRIGLSRSSVSLTRAFKSRHFFHFPIEMIMHIVRSDKLNIEEDQIWKRCFEWCKLETSRVMSMRQMIDNKEDDITRHWESDDTKSIVSNNTTESNTRNDILAGLLSRLKPFIRFPLMSPKQIGRLASLKELFTAEELLNFYLYRFGEAKPSDASILRKRKFGIEKGDYFDLGDEYRYWRTVMVLNCGRNRVLVQFTNEVDGTTSTEWVSMSDVSICDCPSRKQCRNSSHFIDVRLNQVKWRKPEMSNMFQCRLMDFDKSYSLECARMRQVWASVSSMDSRFCDVKIGVRNDDSEKRVWVGANRSRLKEQSAFFRAVWNDPTGLEEKCECLELDGVSEAAMRAVVAVSYGQFAEVLIDRHTVVDCLYAGLKYGIQVLYECCDGTIQEWANSESECYFHCFSLISDLNALGMSDYACKLSDKMRFYENTKKIVSILRSHTALSLPFEIFAKMINQDSLNVPEMEIWERCIEWARNQVEEEEDDHEHGGYERAINEELRRLKPFVRFTRMSNEQLATLYRWSDVVTPKELSLLYSVRFDSKLNSGLFCNTKPRITML